MPVSYPLINGNRYDYSSIEININGIVFRGIKSIDYSDSLTPGKVRGTSAMPLGRTRGEYEAEASMEMFKEDWAIFAPAIAALPPFGLGEASFVVTIGYAEMMAPVIVDTLVGCRVKKPSQSFSAGSDPLTVKIDLDPLYILHNGVALLSPQALLK